MKSLYALVYRLNPICHTLRYDFSTHHTRARVSTPLLIAYAIEVDIEGQKEGRGGGELMPILGPFLDPPILDPPGYPPYKRHPPERGYPQSMGI